MPRSEHDAGEQAPRNTTHHDDAYPAGNERLGPVGTLAGRSLGQDFEPRDGWRMYHGSVVPGFPQHPHGGFGTVTIVHRGLIDHADSLGAAARYGGGDVQWLTAGRGIQHAEMFPVLDHREPNPLELFQTIPRHTARDAAGRTTEVTVIAGLLGAQQAPPPPPRSLAAQPDSDFAIWTIRMAPGARWILPAATVGTNRSLYYFCGGGLHIGGKAVPLPRRGSPPRHGGEPGERRE